MRVMWQRVGYELGDVIFPRQCVHCRGLVEDLAGFSTGLQHVCARCAVLLEVVGPPHCSTCGHPFHGVVEGERVCPHCAGLEPVFGEGRTATLFKGAARALVIELKYHHGWHVLDDMIEIFRRAPDLIDWVRGATLVPVPLHPRKARERGYNQAALLAEGLARAAGGGTVVKLLLRRLVDSASQTAFDRRTRMANLKNAFALAPGEPLNPPDHFILVDDVFTTGSTLNSCARALRRAGGVKIDVVTFGHG
jgi:ComF family protein